jgi:hypothetical protein
MFLKNCIYNDKRIPFFKKKKKKENNNKPHKSTGMVQ